MPAPTRPMLLCLLRLTLLLAALLAGVPGRALDLHPGQDLVDLTPHLRHDVNRSADLGSMLARFRADAFAGSFSVAMLESNYAPEVWSAVTLANDSTDDGRPPDPFAVLLSLPLAGEVDIYLVREDGLTESLLTYSIFAPFDPGQHAVTQLRSAEFRLAPQESATLLAHLKFGPFHSFRMQLATPPQVEAAALSGGIGLTAFYAFSLACLLFFVAFYVALKDWISLLYAALFLVGLGMIAYVDGLPFRFLYPGRPDLQSAVGFLLIYALSGSGFLLAAHALAGSGARRPARWLRGLAGLSLLGFLAALVSPGTYAAMLAYLLLAAMFVAVLIGSTSWRRRQGTTHAAAIWISAAAGLVTLAVLAVMATGWVQHLLPLPLAIKAIYAATLIATITNFAAHILLIRREHAQAVAARIDALEQEARRSQELLEAEQAYSRARDLARQRQRQLATASHDLKQPLASLRMTLDGLGGQMDPALRARMTEAFAYMEQLSGEYLRQAAPDDDDAPLPADDPPAAEAPYALSLILQTVQQMFRQEAVSKGLRLDIVGSSVPTTLPPLVLMRIASNLVANAVRYTERGRVLAGVRRRPGAAEIWVCDTGPGMDPATLAELRQEGRKGAQSQGHGLGLALCDALAAEHGLDLQVTSQPGRGTIFRLRLPNGGSAP